MSRFHAFLRDGRILPVEVIRHQPYCDKVYNLHVDEFECYAVGRNSVLVHNTNGPSEIINCHHQLPRQFEALFKAAGLEIEDFTIDMEQGAHRLLPDGLHTGPMNWNWQWQQFFDAYPDAGPEEILDFLSSLRDAFGLE